MPVARAHSVTWASSLCSCPLVCLSPPKDTGVGLQWSLFTLSPAQSWYKGNGSTVGDRLEARTGAGGRSQHGGAHTSVGGQDQQRGLRRASASSPRPAVTPSPVSLAARGAIPMSLPISGVVTKQATDNFFMQKRGMLWLVAILSDRPLSLSTPRCRLFPRATSWPDSRAPSCGHARGTKEAASGSVRAAGDKVSPGPPGLLRGPASLRVHT